MLAARVLFAHLQIGQSQHLSGTCRVWGYPVAVEALQLDDGELLVLIGPVQAQALVKDYALRWGIIRRSQRWRSSPAITALPRK